MKTTLQNEPIYTFNPVNFSLDNIGEISGDYEIISIFSLCRYNVKLVGDSKGVYLIQSK